MGCSAREQKPMVVIGHGESHALASCSSTHPLHASKVDDTKISKVWKDLGLSKFNGVAKATQPNLVNSCPDRLVALDVHSTTLKIGRVQTRKAGYWASRSCKEWKVACSYVSPSTLLCWLLVCVRT